MYITSILTINLLVQTYYCYAHKPKQVFFPYQICLFHMHSMNLALIENMHTLNSLKPPFLLIYIRRRSIQ